MNPNWYSFHLDRIDYEIDAEISRAAASLRFDRIARERGETTVSLDTDGTIIKTSPDGTITPLSEETK